MSFYKYIHHIWIMIHKSSFEKVNLNNIIFFFFNSFTFLSLWTKSYKCSTFTSCFTTIECFPFVRQSTFVRVSDSRETLGKVHSLQAVMENAQPQGITFNFRDFTTAKSLYLPRGSSKVCWCGYKLTSLSHARSIWYFQSWNVCNWNLLD